MLSTVTISHQVVFPADDVVSRLLIVVLHESGLSGCRAVGDVSVSRERVTVLFLCEAWRQLYKNGSSRKIDSQYRAGRPICRKVLKIMLWEVPLADWLIPYRYGRLRLGHS